MLAVFLYKTYQRNSFKIIAVKGKWTSCLLLWSILMDLNTMNIYIFSICHCKDSLPLSLAMTNFTNIHHHEGFWTSYLKQSLTCVLLFFLSPNPPL